MKLVNIFAFLILFNVAVSSAYIDESRRDDMPKDVVGEFKVLLQQIKRSDPVDETGHETKTLDNTADTTSDDIEENAKILEAILRNVDETATLKRGWWYVRKSSSFSRSSHTKGCLTCGISKKIGSRHRHKLHPINRNKYKVTI